MCSSQPCFQRFAVTLYVFAPTVVAVILPVMIFSLSCPCGFRSCAVVGTITEAFIDLASSFLSGTFECLSQLSHKEGASWECGITPLSGSADAAHPASSTLR